MSTQALKDKVTGTEVATKKDNPVAAFSTFLDKFKPQMALALPKHLTADRMARLALSAFSATPKLQLCVPQTIVSSIMMASTLGLEIGVDGQAFLVPYGTTCQCIPGWKGLVDLVNRSGNGTVYTGVIFRDQKYTFTDGSKRELIVHNETSLDAPEDITHAYAIGWVKGASMPIIELWTVAKIKKHRDRYNKQGQKHYSFRDWEMYARKIPLLQVIKYMPKSIELQKAVALSDAAESGRQAILDGDFVTVGDPLPIDEPESPPTPTPTSTASQTGNFADVSPDVLQKRISECTDSDVLDILADEVREVTDETRQKQLYDLINQRRTEIGG